MSPTEPIVSVRPAGPTGVVAGVAAGVVTGVAPGADLRPGERVTFGVCTCQGCDVDLVLATTTAFDTMGAISAHRDHWRLDNLSRTAVLVTSDLEDVGQHVRVPPGRRGVVMPFELARVSAPGQAPADALIVFGPEPTAVRPSVPCGRTGVGVGPLNPETIHYAVLWALCLPRLQGSVDAPVPTTTQIAAYLEGQGLLLSRRSIEHHVDYLAGRLGVIAGPGAGPLTPRGRSWKRDAIARRAVSLGLLDQLPSWHASPGGRRGA